MASTSESKKEEPLIPPLNPYSPQEIASFDKIDLALRSHPELAREGATLLNPKALARLVQGIKFFQDVHLGCHPTSKYAKTKKWPVVKLPDEFFRMRESDGPLFHLFVSAYMYKKEASWRQFDFQSKNRFNDNIALLKKIQSDLVASGYLKRPVVYFDESVPQDQLAEYKNIVKKFGGRVVKDFSGTKGEEDAPTHIVAWDPEEHDSVETLEKEKAAGDVVEKLYLRTLAVVDPTKTKKVGGIIETTMQDSKKKGGKIKHAKGSAPIEFKDPMAFVHWWYHPSSYDEWMPAADVAGPDTEVPPRPAGGPWIVGCKFLRDVALFNEWGWEGDYAVSDYQNKAKCYPALEKKLAEEAKAREAPKPSTLKIRLSLSSTAKNDKAKVDKDEEEEEEVKDREEVRVDVKSSSPKPVLQQESKIAPVRLGMEPKQILTGFYTAGGSKKEKMIVHNGALQPPSGALDLVRDAIKEVQSDAFDGIDKNIKLPAIDSFVRPTLDPNLASKFLVTELKSSAVGSTEITERQQNNMNVMPNKDGCMTDEDGDVKMVDIEERKAPNDDSSRPRVPKPSDSSVDKQSGETSNETHLSVSSSSPTTIAPMEKSLKHNDTNVKLKESKPQGLQGSGMQELGIAKVDVPSQDNSTALNSCSQVSGTTQPKKASADDTHDDTCHDSGSASSKLNEKSADDVNITMQDTDMVKNETALSTQPKCVTQSGYAVSQTTASLLLQSVDGTAQGNAASGVDKEVTCSLSKQDVTLKSDSVDNLDNDSQNPKKANSEHTDEPISSTTEACKHLELEPVYTAHDGSHASQATDTAGDANTKVSIPLPMQPCNSIEPESTSEVAIQDATNSSQSSGAEKNENIKVPASLPAQSKIVTEAGVTVLNNDSIDDSANISRSLIISKNEDKTMVNDKSIDDPTYTLKDPDTAQIETMKDRTPGVQMNNSSKLPTQVSSSGVANVATPKTPVAQISKTILKAEPNRRTTTTSTMPSTVAQSMESDDDIPELQMTEPDVVPDGAYSRSLPVNPSAQKIKKTIPLYGEQELTTKLPPWYDKDAASDIERTLLPEWFNNSADHRTESSYVEAREKIIDEARQSSNKYLTWTAVRRCVAGDAGSIMRLHEFLVSWGFINGSAIGDNAPLQVTDEPLDSASRVWSPEMKNLLGIAVSRWSRKRKHDSESTERLEIDWDAVSKEVGNGATPAECHKMFLSVDFSHLGEGDNVKLPNVSNNHNDTLQEDFIGELMNGVQPSVAKAVINAALDASDGDVNVAQKASIVGVIASKAVQKAREEESTTMRILEEILDLRMAKLENRLSLLDDLEGMMEAERMALELERRDLYTRRCRHWFNADSSM